jgi:hypothetical protein
MAVLTARQVDVIRQGFVREREFTEALPWTKGALNAAAQAVEDVVTSGAVQTALSNAIDAALAPLTMTN